MNLFSIFSQARATGSDSIEVRLSDPQKTMPMPEAIEEAMSETGVAFDYIWEYPSESVTRIPVRRFWSGT